MFREQEEKREEREIRRQEQLAQFFGQLVEKMSTPASETAVARMFATQPKLQKMTPEDDPEAFLVTFERVAEAAGWPKEHWAMKLAPCLTGEAQAAYRALMATEAADYAKVKEAILSRLGITEETYRRRFREYQLSEGVRPRVAGQYLLDQCTRWLQPEEHTPQELVQKIAIEQFASILPPGNREWVKRNQPTTLEKAIILAEAYEDANEGAVPDPTPAPKPTRTNQSMKPRGGNQTFRPWRPRLAPSWARGKPPNLSVTDSQDKQTPLVPSTPVCYRCNEPGHIARDCPMMEVDLAKRSWSAVTAHHEED
ncbi:zinc finger and SCAN domain-containing protein 29-like [Acipenser ruthenus]|nr:zinc finger and SCAN domain-containing protein 29-like [Acipenser ruthenus]